MLPWGCSPLDGVTVIVPPAALADSAKVSRAAPAIAMTAVTANAPLAKNFPAQLHCASPCVAPGSSGGVRDPNHSRIHNRRNAKSQDGSGQDAFSFSGVVDQATRGRTSMGRADPGTASSGEPGCWGRGAEPWNRELGGGRCRRAQAGTRPPGHSGSRFYCVPGAGLNPHALSDSGF